MPNTPIMTRSNESTCSFHDVIAMPSSKLEKLSKTQLCHALKDAISSHQRFDLGTFSDLLDEKLSDKLNPLIKKIDHLIQKHSVLEKKCLELEEELGRLKSVKGGEVSEVYNEIERRLQRQSNLIISGLLEKEDGSVKDRNAYDVHETKKMFDFMGVSNVALKSVQRLGQKKSNGIRLLRVTCEDVNKKWEILGKARTLRNSDAYKKIFLNQDLTAKQQEEQFKLRAQLKDKRAEGIDAVIYRGKVVARENIKNFR